MRTLVMAFALVVPTLCAGQVQVLPSRPAGSPYRPGTPQNPLTVYENGRPAQQLWTIRPAYPVGSPQNPYLSAPLGVPPLPAEEPRRELVMPSRPRLRVAPAPAWSTGSDEDEDEDDEDE